MVTRKNKICVLGAAGSIGSRLVIRLHEQGYEVTAVVRSWASAVRIGRYDVKLVSMDLLSSSVDELANVMKMHDVVVDCTYSTNPQYEQRISESKRLAQTVSSACLKAGVGRLIHYGTISIYPADGGVVNEETLCANSGDPYGDSKLAAEEFFLRQQSEDLAVTVLQLPIVFGPFMGWSMKPVSQMSGQALVMPDGLKGFCAPLFVDDVVRATILAFDCHDSYGERILLSDRSQSWYDYYRAYAQLSPSLSLRQIDRERYTQENQANLDAEKPFQRLKKAFVEDGDFRQLVLAQWGVRSLYALVKHLRGQHGVDQIKNKIAASTQNANPEQQQVLLNSASVELFDSLPKVTSNKAEKILKLEKYTDFDEAMLVTGDWLKWARLID